MKKVLEALYDAKQDERGKAWVISKDLQEKTRLTPPEINNAVSALNNSGLVELQYYFGTTPFTFSSVTITIRGRCEFQKK